MHPVRLTPLQILVLSRTEKILDTDEHAIHRILNEIDSQVSIQLECIVALTWQIVNSTFAAGKIRGELIGPTERPTRHPAKGIERPERGRIHRCNIGEATVASDPVPKQDLVVDLIAGCQEHCSGKIESPSQPRLDGLFPGLHTKLPYDSSHLKLPPLRRPARATDEIGRLRHGIHNDVFWNFNEDIRVFDGDGNRELIGKDAFRPTHLSLAPVDGGNRPINI